LNDLKLLMPPISPLQPITTVPCCAPALAPHRPADDYAPPEKKAKWFAFFYMCIPAGYALGYVYGGLVAAALGWRAAFYIAAGVMVPFVALMFLSTPLHLHGSHDAGPGARRAALPGALCLLERSEGPPCPGAPNLIASIGPSCLMALLNRLMCSACAASIGHSSLRVSHRSNPLKTPPKPLSTDPHRPKGVKDVTKEFFVDTARIFKHPVWVLMVAGYTCYAAVIGVFAFWGPKAGKEIYDLKGTSADLIFGGVTVVTGVIGGLGGGALLDWMGSTLRNANLICVLANWGGLAMCLLAFLATRSFYLFIALFAVGELLLFCIQARPAPAMLLCML
jgi:predicted MFS family arabinose efflux permease